MFVTNVSAAVSIKLKPQYVALIIILRYLKTLLLRRNLLLFPPLQFEM
ncbi:hypothetical protein EMIT091MI3_10434 [Kosakonia quasisacchari]